MSKQCIFCEQEIQYKVDRTGNLRMYFNCINDGFYAISQASYARVEMPVENIKRENIRKYNESKNIPLLGGFPIKIIDILNTDVEDLLDYWNKKLWNP